MSYHDDDWGDIEKRSRNKKQRKQRRKFDSEEEKMDREFEKNEEDAFLSSLSDKSDTFGWMKEKRYRGMFRDIEAKLQGVMGKGQFEWVDRRVFDQVFDRLTLMSVYKLMTTGVIDTLDYPIARGKEAHVFHGTTPDGETVAVKIFHTSNAVFKNLINYIEGDQRFGGLRRRHRDIVDIWVRKEHRNLLRYSRWGLNVPNPRGIHRNVLVMDYIGDDVQTAKKLREVIIEDPAPVYEELLTFLAVSWQKANLVHGDFSPFNILWHEGRPVVIDVGQAVIDSHPKAKEFLVRDVTRLVEWANKNGMKEITLAEALMDVLEMDLSHIEHSSNEEE